MGAFDYVRCDYPLPDRPVWAKEFQTKDLLNCLDRYVIKADGQVYKQEMGDDQRWTEETPVDLSCGFSMYDFNWAPDDNLRRRGDREVVYYVMVLQGKVVFVSKGSPAHQAPWPVKPW